MRLHNSDVIMSAMASEIAGASIVYSNVCSGADQRKHQSSASLAFGREIHRWPVNSPHNGPLTRKMFPFDDVIVGICLHFVFTSYRFSQLNCALTFLGDSYKVSVGQDCNRPPVAHQSICLMTSHVWRPEKDKVHIKLRSWQLIHQTRYLISQSLLGTRSVFIHVYT